MYGWVNVMLSTLAGLWDTLASSLPDDTFTSSSALSTVSGVMGYLNYFIPLQVIAPIVATFIGAVVTLTLGRTIVRAILDVIP